MASTFNGEDLLITLPPTVDGVLNLDWIEVYWWRTFVINPLLEKFSYSEILEMDLVELFENYNTINYVNELVNAQMLYSMKKDEIKSGKNLPQVKRSDGSIANIEPVNVDVQIKQYLKTDEE